MVYTRQATLNQHLRGRCKKNEAKLAKDATETEENDENTDGEATSMHGKSSDVDVTSTGSRDAGSPATIPKSDAQTPLTTTAGEDHGQRGLMPSYLTKHSTSTVHGIPNRGNTCFMNAAIQCLANLPAFKALFTTGAYKEWVNNDSEEAEVAEALANVFLGLESRGKVDTLSLKSAVTRASKQFVGFRQQDATEFISVLFNCLHDGLKISPSALEDIHRRYDAETTGETHEILRRYFSRRDVGDAAITTIPFEGEYERKSTCTTCHRVTRNFGRFTSLELPIPQTSPEEWGPVTLEQCIEEYQKLEVTTAENKVFCAGCGANQQHETKLRLDVLPEYLIIQLKRWHYRADRTTVQIDAPVDYGMVMTIGGVRYKFRGACNYSGHVNKTGGSKGHFTAIVEKGDGRHSELVSINDETIKYLRNLPKSSQHVYALFYIRAGDEGHSE